MMKSLKKAKSFNPHAIFSYYSLWFNNGSFSKINLPGKELDNNSKQLELVINHYIKNPDISPTQKNVNVNIDEDSGLLIRMVPMLLFFNDSLIAMEETAKIYSSMFSNNLIYYNLCDFFAIFIYRLIYFGENYLNKQDFPKENIVKFNWVPKNQENYIEEKLIDLFKPFHYPEEFKEEDLPFVESKKSKIKKLSPATILFNALWIFIKFDSYYDGIKYILKKESDGFDMEYIGGLYGIISTLYYKIDHYKYVKKILSSQEMFMISKYSYGLCNSREQFWEEIENKKKKQKKK